MEGSLQNSSTPKKNNRNQRILINSGKSIQFLMWHLL